MRSLLLMALVFIWGNQLYAAYSIAEDEIRSTGAIEFQDYTGRPRIINTRAQVQNIGKYLANSNDNDIINYVDKYSVRRVRSESTKMYSADIFSLLQNARANKIKDIRSMIGSFLQTAYGYSKNDALALATFVTYYNSFYHNKLDYIQTKYDPAVLQFVSEKKVGLSTNYKNWAGKSEILIPLSNTLGVADAMELGNKNVKDALKQEPDKGISEREAINNLQENQLDSEKQSLDTQEKNVQDKKTVLDAQRNQLEDQLKGATTQEDKKKIEEQLAENQKNKEALVQEEKKIEEQKKGVESQKAQVKQDKQEIQEDKQKITNNAPKAEPTNVPALKENTAPPTVKEIHQETENQKKEVQQAQKLDKGLLYFLKKVGYYNGEYKDSQLVTIDAKTKKLDKESKLATISGNQFDIFDQGIVVIARENPKSDISHLTLLNKSSLDIVAVGEENIYAQGIIRMDKDRIYAVYQKEDSYYLGVFDLGLKLLGSSPVVVDKDTFVTLFQDKAYVTGDNGSIISLGQKDLSLEGEISK